MTEEAGRALADLAGEPAPAAPEIDARASSPPSSGASSYQVSCEQFDIGA